jgi:hypothetical protein
MAASRESSFHLAVLETEHCNGSRIQTELVAIQMVAQLARVEILWLPLIVCHKLVTLHQGGRTRLIRCWVSSPDGGLDWWGFYHASDIFLGSNFDVGSVVLSCTAVFNRKGVK